MKIAVVGTGGVGGYFGGLLARVDQDVAFVARGAHLRAMRARGLRIESVDGPFTIAPLNATDDPGEIGLVDLVMVCVKNYDLPAAIEQMRPLVGPETAILTLQNGVEAPDMLADVYGREKVLPGVVYCEVAVKEPGVIFQGSQIRRILFGERDGTLSPRARQIADMFAAAGAETILSDNIFGALWSKFCFICGMSGVTTLTRQPVGPILADEEARLLLRTVVAEAYAVARASGVHFDADPVETGMANFARFPHEARSSMQRDLDRGARLEVNALNGAVVRMGRALGIETPANQAIFAALRLAVKE
ncbi:MAG TPA: 2-dehydropantoate 2-reductase [Roseiflexaceae bacterium]|nr:2-dehydropantoate 2-reductase [Roseiflexaceae bacterium]